MLRGLEIIKVNLSKVFPRKRPWFKKMQAYMLKFDDESSMMAYRAILFLYAPKCPGMTTTEMVALLNSRPFLCAGVASTCNLGNGMAAGMIYVHEAFQYYVRTIFGSTRWVHGQPKRRRRRTSQPKWTKNGQMMDSIGSTHWSSSYSSISAFYPFTTSTTRPLITVSNVRACHLASD